MKKWILQLSREEGRLVLEEDGQEIASRKWQEKRDTSERILRALQEIRREEKLQWGEVPVFELNLDLPPSATARRIAETFAGVYTVFVTEGRER